MIEDFFAMMFPLMVVDYFDILGSARGPTEADAPLIVDPYRMLPFSVSRKCFEMVGRRHPQGVQRNCRIQHAKLAPRDWKNV
jgi:hypothetical protein